MIPLIILNNQVNPVLIATSFVTLLIALATRRLVHRTVKNVPKSLNETPLAVLVPYKALCFSGISSYIEVKTSRKPV